MLFQVDPYDIIGILIETLIYGAFLVLFTLSTVLLLQRRRACAQDKAGEATKLRSLNFYLVMSVLMFCTISAKWIFYWPEVLPFPGPEEVSPQIPRLSRTAYRFKESCIQATVLLGDSITIYRLWVLTSGSILLVTPPIMGLFGFIACAISLSGPFNDTRETFVPIQNGKLKLTQWDVAATATTLSITIYVTVVISWIILSAQSRAGVVLGGHRLKKAVGVIVESAAISATWNLLFFIAGLGFQCQIALALLDSLPAVYGVSAMLINVRVGLGFARNGGPGGHRAPRGGRSQEHSPSTLIFTHVSTIVRGDFSVETDDRCTVSSVTAGGAHV